MMKLLRTKKHQFIITMRSTYKGNVNTNRVQKRKSPTDYSARLLQHKKTC